MYALAKTEPRVSLKMSWIHQKLVQFCQNPLKYVTICCSHFGLLSANRNPYFGLKRNFTETPNFGRYRNRHFGLSLQTCSSGNATGASKYHPSLPLYGGKIWRKTGSTKSLLKKMADASSSTFMDIERFPCCHPRKSIKSQIQTLFIWIKTFWQNKTS